jgi:hypothetical protein
MTTCPCNNCGGAPVWGGGVFIVIENPACIKGGEGTWGVAGPWVGGPHVGATVPAPSREAAEKMAVELNARGVVFRPQPTAEMFELDVQAMKHDLKTTEEIARAVCVAWSTEGKDAAMAVCIANGIPMVKKNMKFNTAECAHYIVKGKTIFMG